MPMASLIRYGMRGAVWPHGSTGMTPSVVAKKTET
jgi:hypothetical protein